MTDMEAYVEELMRQQRAANGRIRADLAAIATFAALTAIMTLCIWARLEFRAWYTLVALPVVLLHLGRATERVQEEESPHPKIIRKPD